MILEILIALAIARVIGTLLRIAYRRLDPVVYTPQDLLEGRSRSRRQLVWDFVGAFVL